MEQLPFRTDMSFAYGAPAELLPGIVRLVAGNAGPFTFKGTNTYIVGTRSLAIIDPGPSDAAHLDAILSTCGGRPVTHIITTHAHRDHVDGVAALKAATNALHCAHRRSRRGHIPLEYAPQGREFIDVDLDPDLHLGDGDILDGGDWTLEALHTPGHAPDHLCLWHRETNALFSGDHIMAWNTSVVAPPEGNMADYIRSLELMLARDDTVYLPGHGGRVLEPQRTARAYLVHRRLREQAIFKAIKDGAETIEGIVPAIYPEIAPKLIPAATLTVLAHVALLAEKGLVVAVEPLRAGTKLRVA